MDTLTLECVFSSQKNQSNLQSKLLESDSQSVRRILNDLTD